METLRCFTCLVFQPKLHDVFESLGCKMMGYTSQMGYEHEDSKAIRGDLFCGLLCDQVNQEELTEERVQNWVSQLKLEGMLEGGAAPVVESVPQVSAPPVADVDPAHAVAELEQENTKLRELLEDNSRLLDETISVHGSTSDGYAPHYNAKTGKTMWISPDGRSCYYTVDPPTSNKLSP